MAKKEAVEILVIADRSGSMSSIRDEAIGGFNNFLAAQQAVKGAANLTLVLFDDQYEVPVKGVKIKEVKPLTAETFVPRGLTAMNDAIGKALAELEIKNPKKAVICILTDGEENASREFTQAQVKEKVKAAEERDWEVIFLAANIDAQQAARDIGKFKSAGIAFAANAQGMQFAYDSMCATTTTYRSK
jgi:uncharacterized protein with von Willebrand factor type A (vWA) domain